MTVCDALNIMVGTLNESGVEKSHLEAEVLLSHMLGVERHMLITTGQRVLNPQEQRQMRSLLQRRSHGEPTAYIIGKKEFYSLEFEVNPDVLIPRPETEMLVDLVLYHAPPGGRVLDVGTGSGAIAISVKRNRPDCEVVATDISGAALRVAGRNCRSLLHGDMIAFRSGDLFEAAGKETFDIIVSNPPYVDPGDRSSLQRELSYEPECALYAANGGTETIERLVKGGREHLVPGGIMIIEIGSTHREYIIKTGPLYGLTVSVLNDYAGLARVGLFKKQNR